MSITANIICDSIYSNKRLTTFVLKYPRYIHSELMTHRVFSRNAASSRAIPAKKLINQTINDMAWPVYWGQNQAGMQANSELGGFKLKLVKFLWRFQAIINVGFAHIESYLGLHKQLVNRPLEAFTHITTIVTATEFENFFALRYHKDAQPEIKELARQMLLKYKESIPKQLNLGEWHIPFIKESEIDNTLEQKLMGSVARCARVSYLNHDGQEPNLEKDIKLYNTLRESGHFSPFEHQACAINTNQWFGNFYGWMQYRKTLENESRKFDLNKDL